MLLSLFLLSFISLTLSINPKYIHQKYPQHNQQPLNIKITNPQTPKFSTKQQPKWKFLKNEPQYTLQHYQSLEPSDSYEVVYNLITRVLSSKKESSFFILELITTQHKFNNIPKTSTNNHQFWSNYEYLDIMELDNNGTNPILRGSSIISLISAFNWYLNDYLNTTYDWRTYSLNKPNSLNNWPLPNLIKKKRSVPFSYYENVCTVSYTQAFWDWNYWEKHLDWMAMQGINLPLAFTGQEYIWAKTFDYFGFNKTDLQAFFSGPGFFAWQRMGNLRGWGGPIRESTITDQYNLQLKILARMNSFKMRPVLTCFAGHVPYAITRLYPNASVIPSPNWWGSIEEYCCDLLLNFSDPLFLEIGSKFIEFQTKYFGTGNIYQCDTFNEMDPPELDSNYLQSVSRTMYKAMNDIDINAVWLMQGWAFVYNPPWNTTTVSEYLSGVPKDGLIILDLYSEVDPRYIYFESFFGYPWIWNTLHNFGGNNGFTGILSNITAGIPYALNYPGTSVIGVGTTMEGIWQNYIVYDLTYEMGYHTNEPNLDKYVNQYAIRRYGLTQTTNKESVIKSLQNAWIDLKNVVYSISHWGGVQKNMMVCTPSLVLGNNDGFQPTKLLYNSTDFQSIWKQFINIGNELTNVAKFNYDLVDITRQAISDQFYENYVLLIKYYTNKDVTNIKKYGNILIDLINDIEKILNTNYYWLLGPWIQLARNQTNNIDDQNWWEFNAKNQITLWGPNGEISNYASKNWAGLISDYHKPSWIMFIDRLVNVTENGGTWNQTEFVNDVMNEIEQPWQYSLGNYSCNPVGNSVDIACELYIKWNVFGDTSC